MFSARNEYIEVFLVVLFFLGHKENKQAHLFYSTNKAPASTVSTSPTFCPIICNRKKLNDIEQRV